MNCSNIIEVCFITTTQYDLLITDIYARYIYDKYGVKSKVLYRKFDNFEISKFNTDGKYQVEVYSINNKTLLGKCLFALKCGYLFPFSKWKGLLDKEKRIVLFVFTDTSKLSYRMIELVKKWNSNNLVYIIDEGTDTYSDTLEVKNEVLWKAKHLLSKVIFGCGRTSKVIGDNKKIDGAIVRYPDQYRCLKKAVGQQVVQQRSNILSSAHTFASHYEYTGNRDLKCDILYLGQPYYKNGLYFEPEIQCVSKILSAIPSNYRILIKPHPRDAVGKYDELVKKFSNVSLVEAELAALPVEALAEIANIRLVVCIQSTAAISLAEMFPQMLSVVLRNTPESEFMFSKVKAMGEELPDFNDKFFVSKNNNLICLHNLEEFTKIVDRIPEDKVNQAKLNDDYDMIYPEIDLLIDEIGGKQ